MHIHTLQKLHNFTNVFYIRIKSAVVFQISSDIEIAEVMTEYLREKKELQNLFGISKFWSGKVLKVKDICHTLIDLSASNTVETGKTLTISDWNELSITKFVFLSQEFGFRLRPYWNFWAVLRTLQTSGYESGKSSLSYKAAVVHCICLLNVGKSWRRVTIEMF